MTTCASCAASGNPSPSSWTSPTRPTPPLRTAADIDGALLFLKRHCPAAGRFDEYSLHALRASLAEMAEILGQGPLPGFDSLSFLEDIALNSSVGGQGPRSRRSFGGAPFQAYLRV